MNKMRNYIKEYIIFCDESVSKGVRFSNFYGGAILKFRDLEEINKKLSDLKDELHLSEIKMQNVTIPYLSKYKQFLNAFLDFVEKGMVKVRVIFSDNTVLSRDPLNTKNRYSKFYYLFIKHAFVLAVLRKEKTNLRLYFDQPPNNIGANTEFKQHIWGLQFTKLLKGKIKITKDNIVDIDSKNHPIVQAVDLITGIMEFYANDYENGIELSKRGIAKMELYKLIRERIDKINPNYFIGINVFEYIDAKVAWHGKYLHCQFKLK